MFPCLSVSRSSSMILVVLARQEWERRLNTGKRPNPLPPSPTATQLVSRMAASCSSRSEVTPRRTPAEDSCGQRYTLVMLSYGMTMKHFFALDVGYVSSFSIFINSKVGRILSFSFNDDILLLQHEHKYYLSWPKNILKAQILLLFYILLHLQYLHIT